MGTIGRIARQLFAASDMPEPRQDWVKNFIVIGPVVNLAVEVVAAEMEGWRANLGISKSGMVIEEPFGGIGKSKWTSTFDGAVNLAKDMAKENNVKWNPKPYGDRSRHNLD